jgi:hypothetical protein
MIGQILEQFIRYKIDNVKKWDLILQIVLRINSQLDEVLPKLRVNSRSCTATEYSAQHSLPTTAEQQQSHLGVPQIKQTYWFSGFYV